MTETELLNISESDNICVTKIMFMFRGANGYGDETHDALYLSIWYS
jgi:hypothetical protein